jgi:hypothetical protein
MVQTSSDPIFSSLGKPAGYKEKKIDTKIIEYRDPSKDGLDSDIIETHKSNDLVSGQLQVGKPVNEW